MKITEIITCVWYSSKVVVNANQKNCESYRRQSGQPYQPIYGKLIFIPRQPGWGLIFRGCLIFHPERNLEVGLIFRGCPIFWETLYLFIILLPPRSFLSFLMVNDKDHP